MEIILPLRQIEMVLKQTPSSSAISLFVLLDDKASLTVSYLNLFVKNSFEHFHSALLILCFYKSRMS